MSTVDDMASKFAKEDKQTKRKKERNDRADQLYHCIKKLPRQVLYDALCLYLNYGEKGELSSRLNSSALADLDEEINKGDEDYEGPAHWGHDWDDDDD